MNNLVGLEEEIGSSDKKKKRKKTKWKLKSLLMCCVEFCSQQQEVKGFGQGSS
jgi:hypothetical protein